VYSLKRLVGFSEDTVCALSFLFSPRSGSVLVTVILERALVACVFKDVSVSCKLSNLMFISRNFFMILP